MVTKFYQDLTLAKKTGVSRASIALATAGLVMLLAAAAWFMRHDIQAWAESQGFAVVREYTGHGVGRDMHEDPQIPNWGKARRGRPLHKGMTFALEPMLTVGPPVLRVKNDFWTVATVDGSLCAHFEHTLAVTDGEADVLTL